MMQRDNIRIKNTEHYEIPYIAEMEKRCFSICAWTESMFEAELDNPKSIMLTAYYDNVIAGYAVMQTVIDEAEIMVIAVDEPFRKKGIAQFLIDCMENDVKENVLKIMLEVREKNYPAIKLYEKNGFKKAGLRKNYYSDFSGKPPENAVLMSKLTEKQEEKCKC